MSRYVICAWNVNGYSAKIHEWMKEFLRYFDVLFLSETKRSKEYLEDCFKDFVGYKYIINSHNPYRYHGVVMLIRDGINFTQMDVNLGIECRKDSKSGDPTVGRIITIKMDKFIVVGTYIPNSGLTNEPVKYDYRVNKWDPAFYGYLTGLKKISPVVWIGDINVGLTEDDVSNPKYMNNWAGFRKEERLNFYNFLKGGWIDVWRSQHKQEKSYTWKGNKHHIDNYGMRIDNIIVSDSILSLPGIGFDSKLYSSVTLSDHIPVCSMIGC